MPIRRPLSYSLALIWKPLYVVNDGGRKADFCNDSLRLFPTAILVDRSTTTMSSPRSTVIQKSITTVMITSNEYLTIVHRGYSHFSESKSTREYYFIYQILICQHRMEMNSCYRVVSTVARRKSK